MLIFLAINNPRGREAVEADRADSYRTCLCALPWACHPHAWVHCCAPQGGLALLGLMTSDETLAELGFLGQRMTYVCQTACLRKTKVVNPKYCPQMSPFYCSPDSFDCKDFLILLYVTVCMHLCDWHWIKLIQKNVAQIKQMNLQNMKRVTQERQLQQVTEIWNYFAFMKKSFLHNISPFCSVSQHLPLRLLRRDAVQTLLPPFCLS